MMRKSLRPALCSPIALDSSRISGPSMSALRAADLLHLATGRRLTAIALVATMFVMGMPLPVEAESDGVAAPHHSSAPDECPLSRPLLPIEAPELGRLSSDRGVTPSRIETNAAAEGKALASVVDQAHLADIREWVEATTDGGGWADRRANLWRVGAGEAQQSTASGQQHRGALFWAAVGAGVGAGAGLINMAVNPDCRYSESLCPLAPIYLGITGATIGFFLSGILNR
jgi:hypothetical protein